MKLLSQIWPAPKPITILLAIIVAGAFLRLYQLGSVPHGYTWDEAAITYNAWGISEWRRDEHANRLPVSFKSFGDYKAPGLIYTLSIPFFFLEPNPLFARVASALAGISFIPLVYWLARQFDQSNKVSLGAAGLTALNPFLINISRVGFEANVSLVATLVGITSLIHYFKHTNRKLPFLIIGSVATAASLYYYHSAKLVVPLLFLLISLWQFKQNKLTFKRWLTPVAIILLLISPLIYDHLIGSGSKRAATLILFDQSGQLQSLSTIASQFAINLQSHLSPEFWIGGQDSIGLRHMVPGYGMLTITGALLSLVGLTITIKQRRSLAWLFITWFIIGLLPSLLSTNAPHALRSLLLFPIPTLLAAIGFINIRKLHPQITPTISKTIQVIAIVGLLAQTGFYLNRYYTSYASQSATDFQYGYRQAVNQSTELGRTADKIFFTDHYGQPYIYILLYNQYTPQEFQFGALANYHLGEINWPINQKDVVIVGTPDEIPPDHPFVESVITKPNSNEPVFVIARTPEDSE